MRVMVSKGLDQSKLRGGGPRRIKEAVGVWPLGVGAVALTLFILTLAPTVTSEDSGELITAAWQFGIPHPPGYPLWTMLCGAFMHLLPVDPIAYRANLFSALCGAGAAVVAYAALRELRIARPLAAAGALVWVWGRWSWSQSVITEVYALNSVFTAALLWCALRWHRTRADRPLMAAALLWGLGMCNHHILALAALPVGLWVLLQQPRLLLRGRLVAKCLALMVVGLLPYAYLPWRAQAQPEMNWGDPSTPERFWAHVTRAQYGAVGPMKVHEGRSPARLAAQTEYLGTSLVDDLTPWLAGAAVVGLILLAWRRRPLFWLVLLWLAGTGLLFTWLANYDLDRVSRWAMRVFLIPVSLGPVLALVVLLDELAGVWRRRVGARAGLAAGGVVLLAVLPPAIQVTAHWQECNYSRYEYAYDHARNLLACMMPRALAFPSGDHAAFPLTYLTMVEKQRPDVMLADIYGYVRPELCRDRPVDAADPPEAWLIKHARRPAYYTTKEAPPVPGARFVTAGLLYHLLPERTRFEPPAMPTDADYRNLHVPTVRDLGACHILVDYEFFRGLHELENHRLEAALAHFRRCAEYGAGIKEAFNNIGSALGEHGYPTAAIPYFKEAAKLDRYYALPRWNLFRLHRSRRRWRDALAQLDAILSAGPDNARAYAEKGMLLYEHLDDADGAQRAWRESLRLQPHQPRLRRLLEEVEPRATTAPALSEPRP